MVEKVGVGTGQPVKVAGTSLPEKVAGISLHGRVVGTGLQHTCARTTADPVKNTENNSGLVRQKSRAEPLQRPNLKIEYHKESKNSFKTILIIVNKRIVLNKLYTTTRFYVLIFTRTYKTGPKSQSRMRLVQNKIHTIIRTRLVQDQSRTKLV